VFTGDWNAFGPARSSKDPEAKAAFEFEGDAVQWRGAYFDDAGKARVSIDGQEVDVVDQYGPERGKPFLWQRDRLGPGKHTLVIESLGEKTSASADVWINIGELAVPFTLPTLKASDIANAKPVADPNAIVALSVTDASGRPTILRDFATAGHSSPYYTWLTIEGVAPTPFSKDNPSRTARAD
jgi:hypothetical protein